ncbi:hypothetical protein SBADM41S_06462 [Streptomyces badius]
MGNRTPLAATLAANSISTAGTSLTLIGVPWFVLETTGSAGRAGLGALRPSATPRRPRRPCRPR